MASPTVVLFRPGKGPFKKGDFVVCAEQHAGEATEKLGAGFVLLVTQELFDQIEAWRDSK